MARPALAKWIEEQNLTPAGFAKRIRAGKRTVYDWCLAFDNPTRRIPSHGWMVRIYLITNGAVTPNSFYDLPQLEPVQLDIVEMTQRAIEREAREARDAAA